MNGHPTTLAWKQDVGGLTKLVLLALADHSGANWSVAYPSQQYLADKCGTVDLQWCELWRNLSI